MPDHTSRRATGRSRLSRIFWTLVVLVVVGAVAAFITEARARRLEVSRLTELLALRDGMTVAEIGAGSGWLSLEIARRVGPSGRVYATELHPNLEALRQAVQEAGLANVEVIEAGESTTNLLAACCEAVVLRRVFHHLSDRGSVTASIFEALKPGGRLAIIEFTASGIIGRVLDMGIDRDPLVEAVSAAGFTRITVSEWPGPGHYVAVFEKAARVAVR